MKKFYVIASPDGKKFLAEGTGNSEHDGDYLVDKLHQATIYSRDPRDVFMKMRQPKGTNKWVVTSKRKPPNYWYSNPPTDEDKELGSFMQTCEVFRVEISLGAKASFKDD